MLTQRHQFKGWNGQRSNKMLTLVIGQIRMTAQTHLYVINIPGQLEIFNIRHKWLKWILWISWERCNWDSMRSWNHKNLSCPHGIVTLLVSHMSHVSRESSISLLRNGTMSEDNSKKVRRFESRAPPSMASHDLVRFEKNRFVKNCYKKIQK